MSKEKQIRLIGTCPSLTINPSDGRYIDKVQTVASWAESDQWDGLLIYTDNKQADPWIVAQLVIQCTTRLRPLIAIQPVYMHPFTAAKMIATLATVHKRRVDLNFVAGAFMRDLPSLKSWLPHDDRYERVVEYAKIITALLANTMPLTFHGKYFGTEALQLPLRIPEDLRPEYTISGSSSAGRSAARHIGATVIHYLKRSSDYLKDDSDSSLRQGVRLGVVVRETASAAWAAADSIFPPDPVGAAVHEYISHVSDSEWVRKLGQDIETVSKGPYWLGPYRNSQSSCPYLVGDFEVVASEIAVYMSLGLRLFLLEQPLDAEDSMRITEVFRIAALRVRIV